ncbi:MAG TPA: monovalent cation:proton antiporter-2 (CPA2) family protein [Steroidobacteraceae bacterium]|jgi:glutathione-regulated potassium-efflux system ancillary protein KefC/glutathione-regulated potassium-efflux system protein KefB|nr:monovalent cation:proton antiporter-2 (CPA2) family protein [Steroidobacteraceae bacterium]
MSLLAQIAIFLAAAVVAIPIFRRFKLGSVLGYLTAGIIIGPASLGLINSVEATQNIAQFGIVLLMFVIGLELQPSRLWVLRRSIFGLGAAQVLATTAALAAAAYFIFAQSWQAALVMGFALSMSSTALALQLLAERGQLNSQFGRASFSILLFQDMSVLPALALLPLLGAASAKANGPGGWLVIKLIAVLATVIIGGRYVLRPMLRIIAAARVPEAFTAAGLLIVLGTALLVSQVGLSLSLGAFLAGVLLADSEFRHELEADIEPFKGLLLGLFFISVGMSANLGLVREKPFLIIGLTICFMILKIAILWLIGKFSGMSPVASRGLGVSLPSGGEFAFVLFGLAATLGIMDSQIAQLLVLVVTASMIVSPMLLAIYDVTFKANESDGRPFDTPSEIYPKVIIAGFGRFGQIVGRILRAKKIAFTALEASQTQVDFLRRFGNQVFYGDASRLELLRAAHAENAEVFVIAVDDVEASVRTAEMIRKHFPHLKVFARARNRQHAFRLMDLDVRYIIRETLVSSLELSVQVLESLGLSKSKAVETVHQFRVHDAATMARQFAVKDDEKKFLETSRESAEQLLHLFEADSNQPEDSAARRAAANP